MRLPLVALMILLSGSAQAFAPGAMDEAPDGEFTVIENGRPEMVAAIRKARESLETFLHLASNPPRGLSTFSVKIGVPTSRGVEFMWISPFSPQGDGFVGRVDNAPRWAKDLHEGDEIAFRRADIVDWLYLDGNILRGNFTACAINAMRPPSEARRQRLLMACD